MKNSQIKNISKEILGTKGKGSRTLMLLMILNLLIFSLLPFAANFFVNKYSGSMGAVISAAVIAVLLAAGVWLLLNWKKMKAKSEKSEKIAYFRPYLSSYPVEPDGQKEKTGK